MRVRRHFKFAWKKNTRRYREVIDDASDNLTDLTEFLNFVILVKRLEHVFKCSKTVAKVTVDTSVVTVSRV